MNKQAEFVVQAAAVAEILKTRFRYRVSGWQKCLAGQWVRADAKREVEPAIEQVLREVYPKVRVGLVTAIESRLKVLLKVEA